MRVTITDIAREAEVSIATVSRYLTKNGYVSQEAATKIQTAIDQLGYTYREHHNQFTSRAIEVNFPNIDNPFYAELFEELSTYLKQKGYDCILHLDHFQLQDFDYFQERFQNQEIAGLITSSVLNISKRSLNRNYPIVSFDRRISPKIPTIQSNNLDAGIQIAQYVLSHGKNNIMLLAGAREDLYPINDRIKGMMRVFNNYRTQITTEALNASDSIVAQKIAIQQFLKGNTYDAICCTDDITALLVKQCTDDLHLAPLITGFDGTYLIQNLFPKLVTVRQNTKAIAEVLSDILLRRIKYPLYPLEPIYTLPVNLIH